MIYDLKCKCGEVSEHVFGMNEADGAGQCPACGERVTRKDNRVPSTFNIAGCHSAGKPVPNYSGYYDEALDTWITSKQHRQDEMDRRGLVPYEPNPTLKRISDENAYIRRNSNSGDLEAAGAIKQNHKAADKFRKNTIRDSIVDKAIDGIKKEQS